ncbi:MAG: stage III sporulation protein AA [Bacillota bacterium]|nr:stage III sporulation protein AA [Bacillota bacterium]
MAHQALRVLSLLGDRVGGLVATLPGPCLDALEEVRLRANRPLIVHFGGQEGMVARRGGLCHHPEEACLVTPEDCRTALQRLTCSSLYALEEEIRHGYLTLPGGHRVGLVGHAVLDGGRVRTLRDINGLNLRLTREVRGAADQVLPHLVNRRGEILSTLVLSPPQAGKTTLLRDLCRQVSEGRPDLAMPGRKVVVVDERSEIAGCYEGVPQCEVGPRTDVLDGCPKAEGVALVLRAMSPEVIVTDELGRPEDVAAVREAVRCGVAVLASAHAGDLAEAERRPALAPLLTEGCFARTVVLSRRRGPGTVERVVPLDGGQSPVCWAVGRQGGVGRHVVD